MTFTNSLFILFQSGTHLVKKFILYYSCSVISYTLLLLIQAPQRTATSLYATYFRYKKTPKVDRNTVREA